MDRDRYGPWAVIAGGSEGVGAAMATQLAGAGFDLVLMGRKPEPLADTAEACRARGVDVRTLAVDLTAPDMAARVAAATDGLEVGLLIYNAGANAYGTTFVDGDLERFSTVVTLNTTSRMALCHLFGRPMRDRGRGGILLVGSFATYSGSPYIAVYNAAKAFSRIFAEGLWYEMAPHGVDVVEFVVGGIRTPAMARRGMKFGPETAEPEDVAREGLAHLADGPVWNSELAGGQATAERLSAWPRGPIVTAAGDNLKALGLYG
jgi:short-subunit dehydrogenase